jgi:hypothetical protein
MLYFSKQMTNPPLPHLLVMPYLQYPSSANGNLSKSWSCESAEFRNILGN